MYWLVLQWHIWEVVGHIRVCKDHRLSWYIWRLLLTKFCQYLVGGYTFGDIRYKEWSSCGLGNGLGCRLGCGLGYGKYLWWKGWIVSVAIGIGGDFSIWCRLIWIGCRLWCCRSKKCVRCGLDQKRIEWLHGLDGNIVKGWGLWSRIRHLGGPQ